MSAWDHWVQFCDAAQVAPDTRDDDQTLIDRLNKRREREPVPDVAGIWTAEDVRRIREAAEAEQREWKPIATWRMKL